MIVYFALFDISLKDFFNKYKNLFYIFGRIFSIIIIKKKKVNLIKFLLGIRIIFLFVLLSYLKLKKICKLFN